MIVSYPLVRIMSSLKSHNGTVIGLSTRSYMCEYRSISWAENNLITHDLCQLQGLAGSDAAFNNQVPTKEIDIRKHICQLKSNSCLLIQIKPTIVTKDFRACINNSLY